MRCAILVLLAIICVGNLIHYARSQPQDDNKYIMETYIVYDEVATKLYVGKDNKRNVTEISTDFLYFMTLVNERLESLQTYGLSVELRILNLDTEDIYVPSGSSKSKFVDAVTLLQAFETYLMTSKVSFDLAILISGYKFRGGITGLSNAGSICSEENKEDDGTNMAAAVVTFDGTTAVVDSIAKEIAKVLGAREDGFASRNIMRFSNTPGAEANYYFSKCTAEDITEYLHFRKSTCLTDAADGSLVPDMTPELFDGRLLSPDFVCERAYGPNAVAFKDPTGYGVNAFGEHPDAVCRQTLCRHNETDPEFTRNWPSDGMSCGTRKICRKGRCTKDRNNRKAKNVADSCPMGNAKRLSNGKTCEAHITRDTRRYCYKRKHVCCETCPKFATGPKGCEYGDQRLLVKNQKVTCDEHLKKEGLESCDDPTTASVCCESCRGYLRRQRGKRSVLDTATGLADSDTANEVFAKITGGLYDTMFHSGKDLNKKVSTSSSVSIDTHNGAASDDTTDDSGGSTSSSSSDIALDDEDDEIKVVPAKPDLPLIVVD